MTYERSKGQQRGRELSKFSQMLFILLCQGNVIHYTLLWSWTDECLQSVATPRDKANCCCTAIVFKAPFCGHRANCCSNKGHMDAHWQRPWCGGHQFCFWLWNMILFFPSLILYFSSCLSLCLVCFNYLGLALHGRYCVPSGGMEVVSASLVPTLGEKKKRQKTFPNHWTHPEPFCLWLVFPFCDWLLSRERRKRAAK